jgi:hypothetical protein
MVKGCACVIAIVGGLSGGPARAEEIPDNGGRARALYDEAKKLENEGRYHEASPLFALSYALDPHPKALFNLAYCYEKDDRIASAWLMWQKGADTADAMGEMDRAEVAREHAKDLAPKVPHVTVYVAPQPSGALVEVTLDGAPLVSDSWGRPIPVDAGAHEVSAASHVLQTWSSRFVASLGDTPSVEVPQLEPLPAQGPALSPPPAEPRSSLLPPIAWTVGGAGVAALGVGAAFGIAGLVNKSASTENRDCVGGACNSTGLSEVARAQQDMKAADVSFAIGGGLIVAGAGLWLGARAASPSVTKTANVVVQPGLGHGSWAVSVDGTW